MIPAYDLVLSLRLETLMDSTHKYIPHLDGLRGIAVLAVIVSHFFKFIYIFNIGWVGVDLFFVLSGFLITTNLYASKTENHYFYNFYIKRFLRIFPVYYLILILLFIIYPLLHLDIVKEYAYLQKNQAWFWVYMQNWLFSIKGWPPTILLSHFWSLAIEEQYYIVWPFIVLSLSARNISIVCILLFCTSMLLRYIFPELPFAYMSTITRLEGLTFGAFIAVAVAPNLALFEKYKYILFGYFIVVAVFYFHIGLPVLVTNSKMARAGYSIWPAIFGLILIFSFFPKSGRLRWFLQRRFLIYTGRISYGLYCYSMILFVIGKDYFMDFLKPYAGNALLSKTVTGFVFVFLSYATAHASYHLFEKRLLKLKSKMVK
jgi:peptidoglycan/LPS O-acetylase OafA/YrhL